MNPPYDHYYEMEVSNIQVVENQDLNCLTISERDDDENIMIHICNANEVIKALQEFQEMRAKDERYVSQEGD